MSFKKSDYYRVSRNYRSLSSTQAYIEVPAQLRLSFVGKSLRAGTSFKPYMLCAVPFCLLFVYHRHLIASTTPPIGLNFVLESYFSLCPTVIACSLKWFVLKRPVPTISAAPISCWDSIVIIRPREVVMLTFWTNLCWHWISSFVYVQRHGTQRSYISSGRIGAPELT
jgi:hypothetical protein